MSTSAHTDPLLPMVDLCHGPLRCTLAPSLGGSMVGLWWGDVPILRPGHIDRSCDPDTMACYPLVPYSNRIGGGQLVWGGRTYALRCNAPREAHALHGVGWQRAWDVVEAGPQHATLELQHHADADWPFDFQVQHHIALQADALVMQLRFFNTDLRTAPVGLGWHPYFVKRSGARLKVPAAHRWEMGPDMLPTQSVAHGGLDQVCDTLCVDHCFDGVRFPVTLQDAVFTLLLEAEVSRMVAYTTPALDALALEPVSHVNNAAQLAQGDGQRAAALGLVALDPGASHACGMRLQVRQRIQA